MIELHPILAVLAVVLVVVILLIALSTHFKLERIVKKYFQSAESNSRARMNQVKEHLDKKVHSTEGRVSTDLHKKIFDDMVVLRESVEKELKRIEARIESSENIICNHLPARMSQIEKRLEKLAPLPTDPQRNDQRVQDELRDKK